MNTYILLNKRTKIFRFPLVLNEILKLNMWFFSDIEMF